HNLERVGRPGRPVLEGQARSHLVEILAVQIHLIEIEKAVADSCEDDAPGTGIWAGTIVATAGGQQDHDEEQRGSLHGLVARTLANPLAREVSNLHYMGWEIRRNRRFSRGNLLTRRAHGPHFCSLRFSPPAQYRHSRS